MRKAERRSGQFHRPSRIVSWTQANVSRCGIMESESRIMGIDEMDTTRENRTEEIERLRDALEVETSQRLQVQRHLERANADFEEFVSTASHGLLESVRVIGSYSQL